MTRAATDWDTRWTCRAAVAALGGAYLSLSGKPQKSDGARLTLLFFRVAAALTAVARRLRVAAPLAAAALRFLFVLPSDRM